MFTGDLNKIAGVERPFFSIDGVVWGDRSPLMSIHAVQGNKPNGMGGRLLLSFYGSRVVHSGLGEAAI
jgi:hypothetical protein